MWHDGCRAFVLRRGQPCQKTQATGLRAGAAFVSQGCRSMLVLTRKQPEVLHATGSLAHDTGFWEIAGLLHSNWAGKILPMVSPWAGLESGSCSLGASLQSGSARLSTAGKSTCNSRDSPWGCFQSRPCDDLLMLDAECFQPLKFPQMQGPACHWLRQGAAHSGLVRLGIIAKSA